VLAIEDNPEIVEAISLCLQTRWPEVDLQAAIEGAEGVKVVKSESFDIIILDINLPDMDGFEVLRRIRAFSSVPVIVVSVRASLGDRAKGLEMGADDYIVKPFSPSDLVSRVHAVLRRTHTPKLAEEEMVVVQGELTLDLASQRAVCRGETVRLTPTEWKLLYVLVKNAGRTVSGEQILREVWGEEQEYSEPLRTYIRRLRDKLQDDPPQMILTDRGRGYRFVAPA